MSFFVTCLLNRLNLSPGHPTVEEFRLAMAQKPAFELRHALRFHKHCRGSSPQDQKEMSVAIIKTLSAMPQFADWKELVIEEERDEVEKVYDDFKDKVGLQTPPVTKVLPPPGMFKLSCDGSHGFF